MMIKRLIATILSAAVFLTLSACAAQSARPEQTTAAGSQSASEPVTVNHPLESKERQAVNAEAAAAVRRYVEARIKTDAFVAADFRAMSADARAQMINELARLWEAAWEQATILQSSAAAMGASAGKHPSVRALSAGSGAMGAPQSTFDPKTWAESFTKQYDSIKGANTIKQLAAQLGTDAKEAYAQLTLAQDIIRSGAAEDAAYFDKLTKIAQATKTACKVGLFVTATIATGGGTLGSLAASSMTLGEAGAVIVGGTDCIVDIAATGSTILLGEGSQVTAAAENLKDKIAPVSAVVGLVTFNPASTGEQIAYIGDTLADWFFDGKVLGVKVTGDSDGATVTANAIALAGMTPQQIAQALEKSGFTAPPATPAPASESPTAAPATPSPVTPAPDGATAAPSAPPSETASASASPYSTPLPGDTTLTDEELSGTYTVAADNGTSKWTQINIIQVSAGTATITGGDDLTATVSGNTITAHPGGGDLVITFSKEGDTIVGRGSGVIVGIQMKYVYTKIG